MGTFLRHSVEAVTLTSSSAMDSGNSPSSSGCGAMTTGLTDAESLECSASETDAFFSRFGRRPNRDATHTVTSAA